MIAITQSEKETIRTRFPDVHIVRTMRQDSKRHHYYMVEERGPVRMLRELRGQAEHRDKKWNGRKSDRRGRWNGKGV